MESRLGKLYSEKKKELGQTGAGLQNAMAINSDVNPELQNIWGKFYFF
jgi:hypothetical protein